MDDFLNKGKKGDDTKEENNQFFDPRNHQDGGDIKNAKPFNVDNYGTLPKGVGMTQIKNRKEGLQDFLKRDDKRQSIDIDKLKN